MSIINFQQVKTLKTLQKEGLLADKKKVKFHDVPEELINEGVQVVLTTDGRTIPEEELKAYVEVIKKIKEEHGIERF
jgi:DNA-directed RNA polymerase subunit F